MKYPVWIKLEEDGRILKAITYLGISDCYDCRYKLMAERLAYIQEIRKPG